MVPFWKLRFWVAHLADLVPASKIAVPIALLWSFLEKLVVGTAGALAFNPVLLGLSVLMVALDTATGCYKAVTSESDVWSTLAFGGVIDKVLKYTLLIVVFSAIASAGERGELPDYAFAWIRDFAYMVVVVREGGSALENIWGKPLGELIGQFRETVRTPQQNA